MRLLPAVCMRSGAETLWEGFADQLVGILDQLFEFVVGHVAVEGYGDPVAFAEVWGVGDGLVALVQERDRVRGRL